MIGSVRKQKHRQRHSQDYIIIDKDQIRSEVMLYRLTSDIFVLYKSLVRASMQKCAGSKQYIITKHLIFIKSYLHISNSFFLNKL
jgi:hypothetical protein